MSFWNGLKQAFGFSPSDEEEYDEYDSSVPTYAVKREDAAQVTETASSRPADPAPSVAAGGNDLPGDIFDAIIELFNSTMPEFVASSLNTEAQRKYIYDRISASLRARIAAAGKGRADGSAPNPDLTDALNEAKEEAASLREEVKTIQANADRQKRALTDRINDLDRQLTSVKAEKERILTSRKRHGHGDPAAVVEKEEEIEKLNGQIASLNSRVEELDAEVTKERTMREQLEIKASMSDAMINDLQAEASRAKEELSKAEANLAIAAEIQDKVEMFEQIKQRKDAKITELADKVAELTARLENIPAAPQEDNEEIVRLRDENASLSHTIETNLYNQANSEMKLRNEIKQLRAELDDTLEKLRAAQTHPVLIDEPAQTSSSRKRRGRPRKSREALDGNIDNTDWLDVPEGSRKFDPDFGYHEPPRTIVPENDAQLSLF